MARSSCASVALFLTLSAAPCLAQPGINTTALPVDTLVVSVSLDLAPTSSSSLADFILDQEERIVWIEERYTVWRSSNTVQLVGEPSSFRIRRLGDPAVTVELPVAFDTLAVHAVQLAVQRGHVEVSQTLVEVLDPLWVEEVTDAGVTTISPCGPLETCTRQCALMPGVPREAVLVAATSCGGAGPTGCVCTGW